MLLIRSGGLQKSQSFDSWTYVGDVLNAVKILNEKDVDELVVLDVDASKEGRRPDLRALEQLAAECFMPLAYGGGVTTIDDARRIMDCGIEKVVLNTSAWGHPDLVGEVASVLGSSSTVVSCDVVRRRRALARYDHVSRKPVKGDLLMDLRRLLDAGAGEVLLQSKDRDGTLSGPDLDMLKVVANGITVPIVYGGGISSLADCVTVWEAGASGAAAGSWFVFRGVHRAVLITYPQYSDIKAAFANANAGAGHSAAPLA